MRSTLAVPRLHCKDHSSTVFKCHIATKQGEWGGGEVKRDWDMKRMLEINSVKRKTQIASSRFELGTADMIANVLTKLTVGMSLINSY